MSAAYRCDRCKTLKDGTYKGDVILRQHDHPKPPIGGYHTAGQLGLCGDCYVAVADFIRKVGEYE